MPFHPVAAHTPIYSIRCGEVSAGGKISGRRGLMLGVHAAAAAQQQQSAEQVQALSVAQAEAEARARVAEQRAAAAAEEAAAKVEAARDEAAAALESTVTRKLQDKIMMCGAFHRCLRQRSRSSLTEAFCVALCRAKLEGKVRELSEELARMRGGADDAVRDAQVRVCCRHFRGPFD
jgi:hypothetical protein